MSCKDVEILLNSGLGKVLKKLSELSVNETVQKYFE